MAHNITLCTEQIPGYIKTDQKAKRKEIKESDDFFIIFIFINFFVFFAIFAINN